MHPKSMHHELKQEAIRLRTEEEMSYDAIRRKLGVSKSTLHDWLKHFPLSRERVLELRRANWTKNQAKIELYRISMAEKRERKKQEIYEKYKTQFQTLSEDSFFVAGLMLYLAEGSKSDDYAICLANTDVRIIKFFIRWLGQYLEIPKATLKAELHLYPTMDISKEYSFWKSALEFEDRQFYKTQIRNYKNPVLAIVNHSDTALAVCNVLV